MRRNNSGYFDLFDLGDFLIAFLIIILTGVFAVGVFHSVNFIKSNLNRYYDATHTTREEIIEVILGGCSPVGGGFYECE